MRADIFVHPGFHQFLSESLSEDAKKFHDATLATILARGSKAIMLCEPRNIGDIFSKMMDPDRIFMTELGQCKLPSLEEAEKLSRLVMKADSIVVHGCYLELCVYDLATRLHDMQMRRDPVSLTSDSSSLWTPLGRFDDANIRLGQTLHNGSPEMEIDPRTYAFFGDETFIYHS